MGNNRRRTYSSGSKYSGTVILATSNENSSIEISTSTDGTAFTGRCMINNSYDVYIEGIKVIGDVLAIATETSTANKYIYLVKIDDIMNSSSYGTDIISPYNIVNRYDSSLYKSYTSITDDGLIFISSVSTSASYYNEILSVFSIYDNEYLIDSKVLNPGSSDTSGYYSNLYENFIYLNGFDEGIYITNYETGTRPRSPKLIKKLNLTSDITSSSFIDLSDSFTSLNNFYVIDENKVIYPNYDKSNYPLECRQIYKNSSGGYSSNLLWSVENPYSTHSSNSISVLPINNGKEFYLGGSYSGVYNSLLILRIDSGTGETLDTYSGNLLSGGYNVRSGLTELYNEDEIYVTNYIRNSNSIYSGASLVNMSSHTRIDLAVDLKCGIAVIK